LDLKRWTFLLILHLMDCFRFSICHIMLSFKYNFIFSFPIWMVLFFSFSCPIVLVRTNIKMLSTSRDSNHVCPVPDVSGKASSISALSMMLTMVSNRWLLSDLLSVSSCFIMTEYGIVSKASYESIEVTMWSLCFILLIWCIVSTGF
jgi:hypothetical protein